MSRTIATVLTLRDNMSGGIVRVSRNVQNMSRETRRASQQVATFANNAKKNFEKVGDKAIKMGLNAAKAIAGIGVAVGGLAIKTGFSEAMDMEGFRTQLETATKSAKKAGEIMKWAVDLANKTPFEAAPLIEGASKLEMMGMSAKKWLPLLGDMAASTNKPIDQAVEAMIDAQAGELERLKEFGITKTAIAKKAGEMFRGQEIVNKKGQIVDQEKFNEAITAIMVSRYKGGMDKLSNTTKGLWSTVTGVTKTALANIVGMQNDGTIKQGSLLDTLKGKIKQVADQFQKWQEDGTIERIGKAATDGFNKIIEVVKKTVKFLVDHKTLIENVVIIYSSFYAAIKIMKVLKGIIFGVQIAMAILNGTLVLTPLGWMVIAIGAVIAAGVLLWKNWDVVKEKADTFGFGLKNAFSNVGTFVGNIFKGMANDFIDSINDMISLLNKLPGVKINAIKKYEMGEYASLKRPSGDSASRSYEAMAQSQSAKLTSAKIKKAHSIPQNALGTQYSYGGTTLVGEHGSWSSSLVSRKFF